MTKYGTAADAVYTALEALGSYEPAFAATVEDVTAHLRDNGFSIRGADYMVRALPLLAADGLVVEVNPTFGDGPATYWTEERMVA